MQSAIFIWSQMLALFFILFDYIMMQSYILKSGFAGFQNPQIALDFPQKDCLSTQKTVNSSMCVRNKTKIITKHYQLLPIITNYYQLLPIITNCYQLLPKLLIYALLSRNFIVAFYARFPQIFWDWKADSADFCTFRMYDYQCCFCCKRLEFC